MNPNTTYLRYLQRKATMTNKWSVVLELLFMDSGSTYWNEDGTLNIEGLLGGRDVLQSPTANQLFNYNDGFRPLPHFCHSAPIMNAWRSEVDLDPDWASHLLNVSDRYLEIDKGKYAMLCAGFLLSGNIGYSVSEIRPLTAELIGYWERWKPELTKVRSHASNYL